MVVLVAIASRVLVEVIKVAYIHAAPLTFALSALQIMIGLASRSSDGSADSID